MANDLCLLGLLLNLVGWTFWLYHIPWFGIASLDMAIFHFGLYHMPWFGIPSLGMGIFHFGCVEIWSSDGVHYLSEETKYLSSQILITKWEFKSLKRNLFTSHYCVSIQLFDEFGLSCIVGFIVLPFSVAILSIGNLVVLLGLWPAQVLGTYYAVVRYANIHISHPSIFYTKQRKKGEIM